MSEGKPAVVAIVGGAGELGSAMARRLERAGRQVIIGSRQAEKAEAAAALIGGATRGLTNVEAAAAGDIVIVTAPFEAQQSVLQQIAPHVAGKVVVDATVPLAPPKVMRVQLPPEGSAAVRAQAILGDQAQVVSAFHNVAARKLAQDGEVDCDVLVFGDDKSARAKVVALALDMGLRGLHAGPLVNSAAAEALTSILIFINRNYAVDGAGIRITGALHAPEA